MPVSWSGGGGGGAIGRGSLGNLCRGCHVNKLSLKEESPLEVEVIKTRVHVDKLNWSYPLFQHNGAECGQLPFHYFRLIFNE